ncbi:unnamed protein product [Mycena citricolor]|uniref:Uncharacterized protein n=1 Tax=Mycena citricolor TaxID=2018698 RepID=A0AAD2JZB0_9AGAR|nr:unnamed protein product [Mycena citricolor]
MRKRLARRVRARRPLRARQQFAFGGQAAAALVPSNDADVGQQVFDAGPLGAAGEAARGGVTQGGGITAAAVPVTSTWGPGGWTEMPSTSTAWTTSASPSSVVLVSSATTSTLVSSLAAFVTTAAVSVSSASPISSSSSVSSSASVSVSSSSASSLSSSSSATSSASATAAASSSSPSPSSSSSSSVASISSTGVESPSSSAALAHPPGPETLTHGVPLYAAIGLGAVIIIALGITIVACIIRVRNRSSAKGNQKNIEWDPSRTSIAEDRISQDCSMAGDRDVGEPKREPERGGSVSIRGGYIPGLPPVAYADDGRYFYGGHPHSRMSSLHYPHAPYPNPFADVNQGASPYYPLGDSTAYPLPPAPIATGYPQHRHAQRLYSNSATPSAYSMHSRNGSICSQLPTTSTLCVANPPLPPPPQNPYAARFSLPELSIGTPREREARPRFMSLPDGRGLEVPWEEKCAEETRGKAWDPLEVRRRAARAQDRVAGESESENAEGWGESLRASVLGAIFAVTGGSNAGEDDPDRYTPAPNMVAKERRESGWKRFAETEMDAVSLQSSALSTVYVPDAHADVALARESVAPTTSMKNLGPESESQNSETPLVRRGAAPRRAPSSVYSTDS